MLAFSAVADDRHGMDHDASTAGSQQADPISPGDGEPQPSLTVEQVRFAIEHEHFVVFSQPILDLKTRRPSWLSASPASAATSRSMSSEPATPRCSSSSAAP